MVYKNSPAISLTVGTVKADIAGLVLFRPSKRLNTLN
jgi:hypothetical protein